MQSLDPEARRQLDELLLSGDAPLWVPQPGPQSVAYLSDADIIFYGGAAGGGKTDLLLGLCLTTQKHSIIFRRQSVQLTGIEERMSSILGSRTGYNSQDGVWRLPGGRVMELGSVKDVGDWMKYQGRAHDLKAFD
ncbi:MAG: terminase, partial [Comamonas sp.]